MPDLDSKHFSSEPFNGDDNREIRAWVHKFRSDYVDMSDGNEVLKSISPQRLAEHVDAETLAQRLDIDGWRKLVRAWPVIQRNAARAIKTFGVGLVLVSFVKWDLLSEYLVSFVR